MDAYGRKQTGGYDKAYKGLENYLSKILRLLKYWK